MRVKILFLALAFLLLHMKIQSQEKIRDNEEFLARAVEFHGHLGPYLVLGLKAGLYANQVLGKNPMKTEAAVKTRTAPPQSCSVDGVQFSTGCTMGKGNISVKEGEGLLITFKKDNRELTMKLKNEIIEEINSLPPDKEEAWENLARNLYKRKTEEIFEIFDKAFEILKEIHREVKEIGKFGKEEFINREFHLDLDGNEVNSEEHVNVLIYDSGGREKMVLQVTYFEPINRIIKHAKEIRSIVCFFKGEQMEFEKCDYNAKQMKSLLPDILKEIRHEKELLKQVDRRY